MNYISVDNKTFAANTLKSYQTYFLQLCKSAKINISLDPTDPNLINSANKSKLPKTEAFLKEADILKIVNFFPTTKH